MRLNVEHYGEKLGLLRLRKCLGAYVKGLPGAADFRRKAMSVVTADELLALLKSLEASLPR